ncbi:urease subunit beta [Isoptericola aurantiacus]|uniref:urease subunit beta n=1 Tax=Isoptericola aurantiacus TaxID=3377839 RepID=UPI00383B588F
MSAHSTAGPGAVRVVPGRIELNADRTATERLRLVVTNTGDRPVQIGSHLHLPDANAALDLDRAAAHGYRLDVPAGTSQRFEPGVSREVDAVALRGARRVPGVQRHKPDDGQIEPVAPAPAAPYGSPSDGGSGTPGTGPVR